MSIVRALAMGAVVVFCGAFVPVGGCAKGCGRVAAHEGDDIARMGTRNSIGLTGGAHADDLARSGAHHADDLAHVADDVHVSGFAQELDQAGLKLSETQHTEVTDALKTIGEELVGKLAEGDDSDDEQDKLRAANTLDRRLKQTLTRDQIRKFHEEFGTTKQIVERLAHDQTLKPASAPSKP